MIGDNFKVEVLKGRDFHFNMECQNIGLTRISIRNTRLMLAFGASWNDWMLGVLINTRGIFVGLGPCFLDIYRYSIRSKS